MHIGNLRTGLYAYLVARHGNGKFILRIEDTDTKRTVPGALEVIYESLRLAHIDYDEGPDKDGGVGPYVQTERRHIYPQYIDYLLEHGGAYRCFCSQEKTQELGAEKVFDECRFLSQSEIEAKLVAGEPYVVRQRIPESGETTFVDTVFGEITFRNDTLDDQVLLKSDGLPTYNFANVVDDHLMGITIILRGVEYLSSTPKYDLLYKSFGWEIPTYVHLPHIVKESGKKLSKRNGDASFQDLLNQGFLPEAVVNYIALLGWNPGDEREFFTMADLIAEFDIHRINKASAGFSIAKLEWLNSLHIRALPLEDFHAIALKFYPGELIESLDTLRVSTLIQSRLNRLTDIPQMVAFFRELPDYSVELFHHDKSKSTLSSSYWVLEHITPLLEKALTWTDESLLQLVVSFAAEAKLKNGAVMWPLRIALSGQQFTPGGAIEIAQILGKEEALRRIAVAIEKLKQVQEVV